MRVRKLENNTDETADWPGYHIVQMVDTACPGDPVTDYALGFQKVLRKVGYETVIFALNILPGMRPEDFRPIKGSEKIRPKKEDILLYHFSQNSKVNPDYVKFDSRRVLVWHGAMPGKFCASYDPMRAASQDRMLREVSWLLPYTEAVIADSDGAARQIREMGFSGPVHVIPQEIPYNRFDPEESGPLPAADADKTLFLAVGDILPERRIGELINCFAVYHETYNRNSRLILPGRCIEASPYYLRLRDYEEQLKMEPGSVFFAGKLSDRDLLPYYLHASAYLDMSEYETFSIPLAAAMFLQLPALCVANDAARQLLGDDALFLPTDPLLAAGLMDRVVRDTSLKNELIIGAKDRLGKFTAAAGRETFVRIMSQMVGEGKVSMTMMKKKAEV